MDSREPEELAAALGLEKAHALDPAAFKLAIEKARALSARITQSPSTADEPAHVFRPEPQARSGEAGS